MRLSARIFRSRKSDTSSSHQWRNMTPDEVKQFNQAFAHMDDAFAAMDRAFDELRSIRLD